MSNKKISKRSDYPEIEVTIDTELSVFLDENGGFKPGNFHFKVSDFMAIHGKIAAFQASLKDKP